jgi:trimeric autotransporter adhesin
VTVMLTSRLSVPHIHARPSQGARSRAGALRVLVLTISVALAVPLAALAAGPGELVRDHNTAPYQPGFSIVLPRDLSFPTATTPVGKTLFFVAQDAVNGSELWKSDGSAGSATRVADINPGSFSSDPEQLIPVNGGVLFTADDGSSGRELWRSDGTSAGTLLVKDILPGPASSAPTSLLNVNGLALFEAKDVSGGAGLWRSDGTAAGTIQVKSFPISQYPPPTTTSGSPLALLSNVTLVNGSLFFMAPGNGAIELWRSDGTTGGTQMVKAFSSYLHSFRDVNGTLFFETYEGGSAGLWKSDGTQAGTTLIQSFGYDYLHDFAVVDNILFFIRNEEPGGKMSLWKSEGTTESTVPIKEIGVEYFYPLAAANHLLFMESRSYSRNQSSLWVSNGTTEGTIPILDLSSASVSGVIENSGTLFFGTSSGMLWKSDGTRAGTSPVAQLPGPPFMFSEMNGTLLFCLQEPMGNGLWRNDGTAGGTLPIVRPSLAQGSSELSHLFGTPSALYFTTSDVPYRTTLWKSNGLPQSTTQIKTFPASLIELVSAGNNLFLTTYDGDAHKLWRSDSTSEGTTVVRDVGAYGLTEVNGSIFFAAHSPNGKVGLWKSDGTAAGTRLIKEISYISYHNVWIRDIIHVNGTVFISVSKWNCCSHSRSYAFDLWRSDGTAAGTQLVKHFGETFVSVDRRTPDALADLTNVQGTLFFSGHTVREPNTLWRSDGTPEGTIQLTSPGRKDADAPADLTEANGELFFTMDDGVHGRELWKSDGTPAGTALVKDILPGSSGSFPEELTSVGNMLFFSANDGSSGKELWRSDGTAGGTILVKDIAEGVQGGVPRNLTHVNQALLFSASDGRNGVELWYSDGTPERTTQITDIAAGPANANQSQLVFAATRLFFTANDGISGQELWLVRSATTEIPVGGGEFVSWLDRVTYQFPPNTFATRATVTHTLSGQPDPSSTGGLVAVTQAFGLRAIDKVSHQPLVPAQPYTITIGYTDEERASAIEETLALYSWDGRRWVKEPSSTVDLTGKRVLATPDRCDVWAVLGETYRTYLSVVSRSR